MLLFKIWMKISLQGLTLILPASQALIYPLFIFFFKFLFFIFSISQYIIFFFYCTAWWPSQCLHACSSHHIPFTLSALNSVSCFLFYGCTHSIWKFLSQGLNPSRSFDLSCSCGNAGSFNPPCFERGIEPTPPQGPKPEWILNPRCHSKNSSRHVYIHFSSSVISVLHHR